MIEGCTLPALDLLAPGLAAVSLLPWTASRVTTAEDAHAVPYQRCQMEEWTLASPKPAPCSSPLLCHSPLLRMCFHSFCAPCVMTLWRVFYLHIKCSTDDIICWFIAAHNVWGYTVSWISMNAMIGDIFLKLRCCWTLDSMFSFSNPPGLIVCSSILLYVCVTWRHWTWTDHLGNVLNKHYGFQTIWIYLMFIGLDWLSLSLVH